MNEITMSEAVEMYRAGNNAGRGYAPDGETIDDAVEAAIGDGWTLLLARNTSDDVAVLRRGDALMAIGGDAGGGMAWAVDIDSIETRAIVAEVE